MRLEKIKNKLTSKRYFVIIKTFIEQCLNHSITKNAAELSYYLLFSFFPMLIFANLLLGYMDISPESIIEKLADYLPRDVIGIVENYMNHIVAVQSNKLLIFGLFFSFMSVMRAVDSLLEDVARAYDASVKRGVIGHFIWKCVISLMLMISIVASLVLTAFGSNAMEFLTELLNLPAVLTDIWAYVRFPILAIPIFVTLSVLYRVAPAEKKPLRYILPGAGAALAMFIATSVGLSFYVENMGNYSVLYGSIGAVIVLMLWLYMCSISLIVGAEINCTIMRFNRKRGIGV